jgi:hypothetical protein
MINSILRLVGQRYPLPVFGLPGTLALLAGLGWGVRVVDTCRRVHALPVGGALISVSLCIAGMMAVCAALALGMVQELRKTMQGQGGAGGTGYLPEIISLSKDLDWPTVFFGVPGTILLLGGIAGGAWVVDTFSRTRVLSLGYALISVSVCIAGEMTWLSGVVLHSLEELILEVAGPESGRDRAPAASALADVAVVHRRP